MRDYLEKREKYIESEMNLVEIDMIGPYIIPEKAVTTYRVTVVQPELPGPYHYPISIRAKLPTIKVPLRLQEPPAKLNLQGLIEKAYTMGRYNRIDYSKLCKPALEGPEKEWASELTKK